MLKKTVFVLLSFNLLTAQPAVEKNFSQNNTKTLRYIFWSGVGISAITLTVLYAPVIIPIAIVNVKAGAVIATAKVAAATAATKSVAGTVIIPVITVAAAAAPAAKVISASILVADVLQPYVAPTERQELQQIVKQQSENHAKATREFKTCMDRHADLDATIVPKECEAIALQYVLQTHGQKYYEKLMTKPT